ncbi:hypothetical protein D3OALGA1CA_1271 [Olavius algarvensis associated proteobacterium Delta 3]|nr:hypothetical protein D3OALGA1CA_1271 [Olavius algarvensis associated proteobacterium Delta 3]CAB5102417.1 hypothetical protein D3OALGB2SA_1917 [Olavius algarvensis associated proteobacterium Delta 3]
MVLIQKLSKFVLKNDFTSNNRINAGLGKPEPLCYAASPIRLCGALCASIKMNDKMDKQYFLPLSQLKSVAEGYGACIATDDITVQGKKVGFMYRESPDPDVPADSGWRFFSGDEPQEHVDNAANTAFYDINTIANYDESIVEFLPFPVGSAFGRNDDGEFEAEPFPTDLDSEL